MLSRVSVFISIILAIVINSLAPTFFSRPALGADRVKIYYGILQRSIPIKSLELYAETGYIDDSLAAYTQYLNKEQLKQFREALITPISLNVVAVSQFLYTPIGERLLGLLGDVIQLESRLTGFNAIRAALIISAAQRESFTLLDVLRNYPSSAITINLTRTQEIAQTIQSFVSQTQNAIFTVNQTFQQEINTTPISPTLRLRDWRQLGRFKGQRLTVTFNDLSRNRRFPTDIYLPVGASSPVIVISHGLGSDRTSFAYLAQHLVSHGFAVVVPEHPGSNAEQQQALLQGRANTVTAPGEFIDRPLDIKYLLDQLTRLSQSNPTLKGRLNLQQVGVVGQSFGGYTALALAGATINFEQLDKDCPALENSLNVSLLLQCLAANLPRSEYNLSDPRVKAVIAINSVSSSVFGQASLSQINVPTMIVASSNDTIAPALPEQILPFTWLTTPNKYLALINGGTHFSTIAESPDATIPIPEQAIGADPALARSYIKSLSVPFFQTYLTRQPSNISYLNPIYANIISQEPLPLSLVQNLTSTQLQ
ncbi:MAG: alpha/beta hydrolase [Calothrix sp. C42_A2020_038]|nr:alpha/beta hydrolase [Calothrix sp. C42_A2020_038]